VVRQPVARAHQNPIDRMKCNDSFILLNAELNKTFMKLTFIQKLMLPCPTETSKIKKARHIIYLHLTSLFLEQVPWQCPGIQILDCPGLITGLVPDYKCHNPEYHNLNLQNHENLKFTYKP
jgi:hypothetical protein